MIIDTSYFLNKNVFIPNVSNNPSVTGNTPSLKNELQRFIDEQEYQLLVSFLGFEQTKELLEQLNADGTFITDPTPIQKWVDLVEGKDQWKGLRYTIGSAKLSLIAYYVFFYYLGSDYAKYTTEGIVSQSAANADILLPNRFQTKAWNEFVIQYGGYYSNGYGYGFFRNWNGTGIQWGGCYMKNNETTLYEFLTKNNEVYDTSFFTVQPPINAWGL